MQTPPFDIWELCAKARQDERLLNEARVLLAEDAARWFAIQKRNGLRSSDSGRCARELWADIHGYLDIPQEPEGQINRLDIGTVMGAWYACLFSVALSEFTPYTCTREEQITDEGIPGHMDICVYHGDLALWVIDIKSNYAARNPGEAKEYQCLQVGRYARGKGAALFSIFTVTPATSSPMHRQDDYRTQDWSDRISAETERLSVAAGDLMPPASPPQAWRCRYCRFTLCEKNPHHDIVHGLEEAS